jgi:Tol biopolymer transport system component
VQEASEKLAAAAAVLTTDRSAWSTNGRKIAFQRLTHRQSDIYVMNADGRMLL